MVANPSPADRIKLKPSSTARITAMCPCQSIHLAIPRGCIRHNHLSATVTQYRFSEVQILAETGDGDRFWQ